MEEIAFITHDFNLPVYDEEITKAKEVVGQLKKNLEKLSNRSLKNKNIITDNIHEQFYEEIIRVLAYVGNLSTPFFEIQDQLEEMYVKQYIHSPQLAKKLWLDHISKLHHPYDLLKNRCFTLLDELDELFIMRNKRKPRNWNA